MTRSMQRDLEAIIEVAASPDPGRRYRSAGDLYDDVESAIAGRPTRARPLPWFEAIRRVARAHPLATGVTIGAVIGVASLVLALTARLESAQLRSQLITSTIASMWSAEQLRGKLGVEKERAELQRSSLASARRLAPLANDRETLVVLARALQGAHEAEIEDADRSEDTARESHLRSAEAIGVEHLAVRRSIASRTDATLEDRAAVAVALVLVGNGQERLERYDFAWDLYRQALAAEEAMLAANPDHPLVLIRICYSFERLSVLARRKGDLDGEGHFVRRRLDVAVRLAATRPSHADSQLNLAEARRFALTIDDPTGSTVPPLPDGDAVCDAHIAHTRSLAQSRPICMRSQREFAIALAIGARRMPRADQASVRIALLAEAGDVLRSALRRQPDDPDLMDPLAAVISDLAQEAEWSGEHASAIAQLEEQHDLIQRLIACRPHEAMYRQAASICERRLQALGSIP
jgi:tetratricopeptide (TPR) repeat protein